MDRITHHSRRHFDFLLAALGGLETRLVWCVGEGAATCGGMSLGKWPRRGKAKSSRSENSRCGTISAQQAQQRAHAQQFLLYMRRKGN